MVRYWIRKQINSRSHRYNAPRILCLTENGFKYLTHCKMGLSPIYFNNFEWKWVEQVLEINKDQRELILALMLLPPRKMRCMLKPDCPWHVYVRKCERREMLLILHLTKSWSLVTCLLLYVPWFTDDGLKSTTLYDWGWMRASLVLCGLASGGGGGGGREKVEHFHPSSPIPSWRRFLLINHTATSNLFNLGARLNPSNSCYP